MWGFIPNEHHSDWLRHACGTDVGGDFEKYKGFPQSKCSPDDKFSSRNLVLNRQLKGFPFDGSTPCHLLTNYKDYRNEGDLTIGQKAFLARNCEKEVHVSSTIRDTTGHLWRLHLLLDDLFVELETLVSQGKEDNRQLVKINKHQGRFGGLTTLVDN